MQKQKMIDSFIVGVNCGSPNNHLFFEIIGRKMFNCFAKNYLKCLNSNEQLCNSSNPSESVNRKIRKLSGKVSI